MVRSSSSWISTQPVVTHPIILESSEVGNHGAAPSGEAARTQHLRYENVGIVVLAPYLHLPMAEAARQLSMPYSAMKHVCRRHGLERWPSRQINAIDRKIAKLEALLPSANLGKLTKITSSIRASQEKKWAIYEKILSGHGVAIE